MTTPTPAYLFKRVKRGTQNIRNYCHQWLSGSFKVHPIRFWLRLRPDHAGDSAPPDTLAGLRGPTSKGESREREKGRGKEEKRDLTPYANYWIRPWLYAMVNFMLLFDNVCFNNYFKYARFSRPKLISQYVSVFAALFFWPV